MDIIVMVVLDRLYWCGAVCVQWTQLSRSCVSVDLARARAGGIQHN